MIFESVTNSVKDANFVLDKMADRIQNHNEHPGPQIVVFQSNQSSGRGTLFNLMDKISSGKFQEYSNLKQFTDKFNAENGKTIFSVIGENTGDNSAKMYNALKAFSGTHVAIEDKKIFNVKK